MTFSNVGIGNVFSKLFGKTATEIMSYLLENTADTVNDKAVRKFIRENTKASSDEIFAAVSGYHIEIDQAKKFELARNHLQYLEGMITQTKVELYVRIKPYFAIKYERLKKCHSHKKAIIKITRMMMVCIYYMIQDKKAFHPTDYTELMNLYFNQHV